MKTRILLVVILLAAGCATHRLRRDFLASVSHNMCPATYCSLIENPVLTASLVPEAITRSESIDNRWATWAGILDGPYHYVPEYDPQFKTSAVRAIFRMACQDQSTDVREVAFSMVSSVVPKEDAKEFLDPMLAHTNVLIRAAASNCLEQVQRRKDPEPGADPVSRAPQPGYSAGER
jgi:hypothetical protein